MTTIKLKNGSGAPLAGDLVVGEPALDLTNKRLYTEDSGGTVIEVGTNPTSVTTGTLTTTGNVGIGTSSPVGPLSLQGDAGTNGKEQGILLKYSNGTEYGALGLNNSSGWPQLMARAGAGITFHTNSDLLTTNEAMRIDSSGRLLVGTTGANYSGVDLTVGDTVDSQNGIGIQSSTTGYGHVLFGDGTGTDAYRGQISYKHGDDFLAMYTAGSEAMRIDASGNVGIGTSSPTGGKLQIDVDGSLAGVRVSGITGSNQDFYAVRNGSSSIQEGSNITLQTATGTTYATTMQLGPTGETLFFNYNGSAWNERMRIDSLGNVGIGASSPTASAGYATLSLNGSNGGQIAFQTGDTAKQFIFSTSTDLSIFNQEAGSIKFATNSTEAMRIDSSGNLLVGRQTTSGLGKLNVEGGADFTGGDVYLCRDSGNLLVGTTDTTLYNNTTGGGFHVAPSGFTEVAYESANAADPAFLVNNTGADGDIIQLRKDGSTVGSIGVDNSDNLYISGGSGHGGVEFGSNAIIPSSNGVAADATVKLGNANYRYTDLYLSGGVYLGGTGSANKLDDYEEGTWTPTFVGTTTNPTVSYVNQQGRYTKVGNLVTVFCQLRTSAASGGSGTLMIAGLPFSVTSQSDECGGSVGLVINLTNSAGTDIVQADDGTTQIVVLKNTNNQGHTPTNLTNNTYFRCTIQYTTA